MRCSMHTRRFLALLVPILLAEQVCAQRPTRPPGDNNSARNCPSGTRCVVRTRCSIRALSTMAEQPRQCGYHYNGEKRICCPKASPKPASDELRPKQGDPVAGIPNPNNCGAISHLQGFVIGGKTARQGAWPWLVAIQKKDQYGLFDAYCTGSMITSRHVISAAHCYEDDDPSKYMARIGHVNQSQAEKYPISRIANHKNYKIDYFYDDIAILTLTRDVNTKDFVPICLPPKNFVNLTGRGTTVAGWGSTAVDGPLSESLQQLSDLPVMSNKRCESELSSRLKSFRVLFNRGINEGFICAAFMDEEKDTCGGDSGGPMMYQEGDRWHLVGIISFGYSCAIPGYPAGYTRVTEYLDFIRSNL